MTNRKEFLKQERERASKQWILSQQERIDAALKAMDESLIETGPILKIWRTNMGFSLQDVENISNGIFSKSSLSLIERGEQGISLAQYRFLEALYKP